MVASLVGKDIDKEKIAPPAPPSPPIYIYQELDGLPILWSLKDILDFFLNDQGLI